jgi:hypothetical protein
MALEEDTTESKERSPDGGARLEVRWGAGIRGCRIEAQLAVRWGAGAEGGTQGGARSPRLQRLQRARHLRPQGGAPWRRPGSGGVKDGDGANGSTRRAGILPRRHWPGTCEYRDRGWSRGVQVQAETTRISANGIPNLSTSVVVPGGLPRAIPVSAIPKSIQKDKNNKVEYNIYFITLIRVHLFGTCRVQVHRD